MNNKYFVAYIFSAMFIMFMIIITKPELSSLNYIDCCDDEIFYNSDFNNCEDDLILCTFFSSNNEFSTYSNTLHY